MLKEVVQKHMSDCSFNVSAVRICSLSSLEVFLGSRGGNGSDF